MSEAKSVVFRREREATWRELEGLVLRAEKKGVGSLLAEELGRLPILYRATLSSLSVARSISLDQNLLVYIETLAARAYSCVYGPPRRFRETVGDFAAVRFPAAVRAARGPIAIAALFVLLGTLAGFLMTLADAERFYSFVSADYAQGRGPSSSTGELREVLYDDHGGAGAALATFATFLFTNNAKIGMLSFALGFVAGVPVFLLLFTNGLILGAFAGLYHSRGLSLDLWGWLLPHGVTEIGALILCGGAGLVLAQSLVRPGRHTRLENLAASGRDAGVIVLGAVVMFCIAGGIEGVFRQLVQDVTSRYLVAITTAALWTAYFLLAGRSARPGDGR